MKALVLNTPSTSGAQGDAPALVERDIPLPRLREHDALVRVAACGICYHDLAVADGVLRRGVKPDVVLGHEISGVVADVGAGVDSVKPGDRVVAALTTFCGECDRCARGKDYRCRRGQGIGHALDGGFAQFARLPQRSLIPIPDSLDLQQACAIACPLAVALSALQDAARLRPGETALVAGAGGGLGVHLAQAAAALGARVLAITGSEHKIAPLEALGGPHAPIEALYAGDLDFSELVMALTDDEGADVALNPVGSALFRSCLASLAQYGRMVALGEIAGHPARFNLAELLFRDARVIGATGASTPHIRAAIGMVERGEIRPVVSRLYEFGEVDDALAAMRHAQPFGRIALAPPP